MINPDAPKWQGAYSPIVYFTIEDDSDGVLSKFLDGDITEGQLITYLLQWDYENPTQDTPPWGTQDRIFRQQDLVLSWNPHLGYASLTRLDQGWTRAMSEPLHTHDCTACVYVGSDVRKPGEPAVEQVDLYIHRNPSGFITLIRRYSSEGRDYEARTLFDRSDLETISHHERWRTFRPHLS